MAPPLADGGDGAAKAIPGHHQQRLEYADIVVETFDAGALTAGEPVTRQVETDDTVALVQQVAGEVLVKPHVIEITVDQKHHPFVGDCCAAVRQPVVNGDGVRGQDNPPETVKPVLGEIDAVEIEVVGEQLGKSYRRVVRGVKCQVGQAGPQVVDVLQR